MRALLFPVVGVVSILSLLNGARRDDVNKEFIAGIKNGMGQGGNMGCS